MTDELAIPLVRIPEELRQSGYKKVPKYQWFYRATLDGLVPEIVRDPSGRYFTGKSKILAIARRLGLERDQDKRAA